MKKEKQMILAKIAHWEERNAFLQNKKTKLEEEILLIDIELNSLMLEYDTLCRELFKK